MSIGSLLALAALAAPAGAGEPASATAPAPEPVKAPAPAEAPKPDEAKALSWSADIKVDVIGPVSGDGVKKRGYNLDESSLIGELDLEKVVGWKGGSLHGWLRNTSGASPNESFGSLEGISNIEGRQRLRLFEFFLQQDFPHDSGDVRVGLIGLDSSFYVTDSSGLLVNPSFGIPGALATSGPGGPPIYPSSSLAVQATWRPVETTYIQFGVFNAKPGTVGDPDGADTSFDDGAMVIGEVGVTEGGKLAIGAWGYTDKVDDLRDVDRSGKPKQHNAHGAYILAESPLNDQDAPRAMTSFFRLGISDAQTSEIAADAQAGLSVRRVFAARPESELAIGGRYTRLTRDAVRLAAEAEQPIERAEYGFEVSLSDKATPWLSVQPNVQVVFDPAGRRNETVWVAGVRLSASFSGGL